ncbi:hypothetical protein Kisp01_41670 [Kineosporia sp. NBRC 101677]|uniref:hypothetical protein n=1 Tax=Kineosporia sp. NBRC 101677 TaxID=3032197 RepID=UPI0024A0DA0B|nr:hypothetical protein [Kineosporia sp. NBRC 101677]GLY17152.1 hypothetical protein Kisp01_41670 [Kineosporia sp. NBRC 101677]
MSSTASAFLAGLTVLLVSACGSDGAASEAGDVAAGFSQAVGSQDGARACALLSPKIATSLAEEASQTCADAVLNQDLPAPSGLERVERQGRSAFVVTATDTMFLSEFPDGWKVIGAGCTEQGSAPYDCAVSGG